MLDTQRLRVKGTKTYRMKDEMNVGPECAAESLFTMRPKEKCQARPVIWMRGVI